MMQTPLKVRRGPKTRRLWMAFAMLIWSVWCNAEAGQVGLIVVDNLNLRPRPGTQAPPITTLKKGSEVEILKKENGWLKVRHAGRIGYIIDRDSYVRIIRKTRQQAPTDSGTAGDSDSRLLQYQQEVDDIQRRIDDAEAQVRDYTNQEINILTTLNNLDFAIDRARRRISENRRDLAQLKAQIQTNREAFKRMVRAIEKNEAYASERLVALYKMKALGAWHYLASSTSVYEMLQRKRYLEQILQHDATVRDQLLNDKNALQGVLERLNQQQIEKRRLEQTIQEQINDLSLNKTNRAQVLDEIRVKKSLQLTAIESLRKAAEALDTKIQSLSLTSTHTLEGVRLDSFLELKGLLKMPVKGKIIRFFGPQKNEKFNVTVFRSGIDIQSKAGTAVQAVFSGRVLYADWFKGYGNMIIIDHGDSYYTIYAHLQELAKQKGDFVNTGEDIATVGETGSIDGPMLHFEVRHHGKPMDPLDWIARK